MNNRAVVVFKIQSRNIKADLDIPLDISANDLVTALNSSYDLGINLLNVKDCYLKSENPIALLKGNKLLKDFGVRNGTVIIYTE